MLKVLSKTQGLLPVLPLPKIDELHVMLNSLTAYSSLDCTLRYHQIALLPEAQNKSAFIAPIGKFQFKKLPFGLAQGPTHFQQLINEVLKGLPFAFGYLDDIPIFIKCVEKHFKHLRTVLDRLRMADLKLKRKKCCFFKCGLHYLDHFISGIVIICYLRSWTVLKYFLFQGCPSVRKKLG